ncbi:MAG: hypothetical protein HOQ37_02155 [Cupriavidus sp.]|nr:hypothetical protein [Cupriavidus sp.]
MFAAVPEAAQPAVQAHRERLASGSASIEVFRRAAGPSAVDWQGLAEFPNLLLASTDDKESAIISIFIDLVIFGLSGSDSAPISTLHAAAAGSTGRCTRHAGIVPKSARPDEEFGAPAERSVARTPSTLSPSNH